MIDLVHFIPSERSLYSQSGDAALFRILTDLEIQAHTQGDTPDRIDVPYQWSAALFYRKPPDAYSTILECEQYLAWILPSGDSIKLGEPTKFRFERRGHNTMTTMHGLPLMSGRHIYYLEAKLFISGSSEPEVSQRVPICITLTILPTDDSKNPVGG